MIGPPGSGKTTIYKATIKMWQDDMPWIYQKILLNPNHKKNRLINYIDNKIKHSTGKTDSPKLSQSVLKFIEDHPGYAQICWQYINSVYENDQSYAKYRFRAAYYLYCDFSRIQRIKEKGEPRPCLIDEGLLQKSFLVDSMDTQLENNLHQYLELLPLPYAVVILKISSISDIVQRLFERKREIFKINMESEESLKKLTAKWQKYISNLIEQLDKYNIRIIYLDAGQPANKNAQQLANELAKTVLH